MQIYALRFNIAMLFQLDGLLMLYWVLKVAVNVSYKVSPLLILYLWGPTCTHSIKQLIVFHNVLSDTLFEVLALFVLRHFVNA